jgi:hypothetical protein
VLDSFVGVEGVEARVRVALQRRRVHDHLKHGEKKREARKSSENEAEEVTQRKFEEPRKLKK